MNMKTRYLISLAALALMMGSCSSEVNQESAQEAGTQTIPFSATISNKSETRGLTEYATTQTIGAQWEVGDQVALIHGATVDVMTVDKVTDTGSATITGTLTGVLKAIKVLVVYIGSDNTAMASLKTTLEGQNLEMISIDDINKAVKGMLATQSGTLEAVSAAADYRYAYADLKIAKGKATFTNTVTLPSMTAIWKLSLTDGTNAIKATQVNIVKGEDEQMAMVMPKEGTFSEFYVAVPAVSNGTINISAATSEGDYTYTKTGVTLEAGKYYQSTVTMELEVFIPSE